MSPTSVQEEPSHDSVRAEFPPGVSPPKAKDSVCVPACAGAKPVLAEFKLVLDAQVPIGAPPVFTVLNCPVVEL